MVASEPGKLMTVFLVFDVAADQFVRLADSDEFLDAWHFVQRAGFYFPTVAGNADRSALRAGHSVGSVTQALDFLAHSPDLLVRSECLHYD
jgi:hypothetical protein